MRESRETAPDLLAVSHFVAMITEELLNRKISKKTLSKRVDEKSLDHQPFVNVYGKQQAPYVIVDSGLSWVSLLKLAEGLDKMQAYLTIKHSLVIEWGKKYQVPLSPLKSAIYASRLDDLTPFAHPVANVIDFPDLEFVRPDIDELRAAESLKRYRKNKDAIREDKERARKRHKDKTLDRLYSAALKTYKAEFALYKAGEGKRPNITELCQRYSEIDSVKLHRWKLTKLVKEADIGYDGPKRFAITEPQLKIVKAALDAGKTYAEIAEKLRLDKDGLNYYMRTREGEPLRQPRKKRFTVKQLELFYRDMHEEGLNFPQVMEKHEIDISVTQFKRLVKAYEFNLSADSHVYSKSDIDNVISGENPLLYIENPSNMVHGSQLIVLNGKSAIASLRIFAMWQIVGRNVYKVKGFDVPLADDELYAVAMCTAAPAHFGRGNHRVSWPQTKYWKPGEYRVLATAATDSLFPKVSQHNRSLPLSELKHFLAEFEEVGRKSGLFARSFKCTAKTNVLDKVN